MTRSIVFAVVVVLLAGCYTLQPAGKVVPELGSQVAVDVNDAGRVALGGSMGPEIGQIEGRLLGKDDGEYLLAVSLVRLLRGGEQNWSGEKIHIKSEYVTALYERRFDRGRSIALGAVGVGGVVVFVTRSILGGGTVDPPFVPHDTAHSQRRRPR